MPQGWSKIFNRINWLNRPSTNTPLNATNLNAGDSAIDKLDDRIITLDTVKADMQVVNGMVEDISVNDANGVITVTYKNGSTKTYDTNLEKIATNFTYDYSTQRLVLTLSDGSKQYVDMSALITQYEFKDSTTIAFSVDSTGKVSASVKNGSITEAMLETGYLANIKVEVAKAEAAASQAQSSEASSDYNAKLSRSYAIGGSGIREGEDADNAMYYYEQAKKTDIGQIRSEVDELNSNLTDLAFGENSGSANIFNGKIVDGLLIETGEVSPTTRITSDFIPVEPNTLYTQIAPTSAKGGRYCEYDANKNLVYFDINGLQDTFTTKPTTKYLRISFGSEYGTTFKNDIAIIKGNATEYVPYIMSNKQLGALNESLDNQGLLNKVTEMRQGKWNISSGVSESGDYYVSSKESISCNGNSNIKLKCDNAEAFDIVFFNGSSFISGESKNGSELLFTTPSNATSFKFNIYNGNKLTLQNVGKIEVYVDSQIEQLKNDLTSYNIELGVIQANIYTDKYYVLPSGIDSSYNVLVSLTSVSNTNDYTASIFGYILNGKLRVGIKADITQIYRASVMFVKNGGNLIASS